MGFFIHRTIPTPNCPSLDPHSEHFGSGTIILSTATLHHQHLKIGCQQWQEAGRCLIFSVHVHLAVDRASALNCEYA
jgi:hypothetical protein